jgi:hypothetical protein
MGRGAQVLCAQSDMHRAKGDRKPEKLAHVRKMF